MPKLSETILQDYLQRLLNMLLDFLKNTLKDITVLLIQGYVFTLVVLWNRVENINNR